MCVIHVPEDRYCISWRRKWHKDHVLLLKQVTALNCVEGHPEPGIGKVSEARREANQLGEMPPCGGDHEGTRRLRSFPKGHLGDCRRKEWWSGSADLASPSYGSLCRGVRVAVAEDSLAIGCARLGRFEPPFETRLTSVEPAPLVTAVIPTRNRLPMLQQAVRSALGQVEVPMRVVVVDEASSDGTQSWLETLDDPRVTFVRHDQPRRLPGARNAGLARVTTPWVAFLDDDDLWSPTKIRDQLAQLAATGRRWCYTAEVTVSQNLRIIDVPAPVLPEHIEAALQIRNVIPGGGSGVLLETALIRGVGGFDEEMVAAEDWECWLRVMSTGPPALVAAPSMAYRWGAQSMSMEVARMRSAYAQVRARHPLPTRELTRLAWARNERFLAFQLARHGSATESVSTLWRSARYFPLRHVCLASWVLALRREWPTRIFRTASRRDALPEIEVWLAQYRVKAS